MKHLACELCGSSSKCPCDGLPRDAAGVLRSVSERISLQPGQIFVEAGGRSSGLIFVTSGVVQIYRVDRFGLCRTIALRRRGHACGVTSLLLGNSQSGIAAVTQAEICHVPHFHLLHNLLRHPSIGLLLLQLAADESRVFAGQAMALSLQNARQRTAASLVLLATGDLAEARLSPGEIPVYLNRQQLSIMVGLSRQHLAAIIAEFEEAGLVRLENRRVQVTDVSGLYAIYEGGEYRCVKPSVEGFDLETAGTFSGYALRSVGCARNEDEEPWLSKSAVPSPPDISSKPPY